MAEKWKTDSKKQESLPVIKKKKYKTGAQKRKEQELKKTEESVKNTRPLSQFFQIKSGRPMLLDEKPKPLLG